MAADARFGLGLGRWRPPWRCARSRRPRSGTRRRSERPEPATAPWRCARRRAPARPGRPARSRPAPAGRRRRGRRRRGRARRGWRRACRGGCTRSGVPSTSTGGDARPSGRARPMAVGDGRAGAALADAVLDGDDERGGGRRRRSMSGSRGLTTRTSHTVADTPCRRPAGAAASSAAARAACPTARMHTSPSPCAHPAGPQARADLVGRHLRGPRPSGSGWPTGPSLIGEGVASSMTCELLGRRRGEHRHARHLGEQGQVEHAVVAGAVVAGDAGPVDAEDHRLARAGRRRG